jgi:dihydrofolate reductase
MRRLIVFNNITLDGYFTDAHGDMSWAHKQDPEWKAFITENAKGGGELLFGRVTYEMMASYWPTPMAQKNDPAVAKRMNQLPKVVFSWTLNKASWPNTRLVKTDMVAEIRKMKEDSGKDKNKDLVIFGSGTIISQLTQESLIDEYQIAVHPVIVGAGRTMFEGLKGELNLKRRSTRSFRNGVLMLCYEPVR